MKKYSWPLIFLILFIFKSNSFAQHVEIGFEAPVAIPTSNVQLGNGVNFSVEYKLPSFLSIKGDIGGISANTKGTQLAEGAYSFFWAEGCLLLRSEKGWLEPYGGIGFGYYKTDVNLEGTNRFVPALNGLLQEDNFQYKFGSNLRAGVDIFLSSIIVLNTEFKYVIFNPSMTITYENSQNYQTTYLTKKVNLDSAFIQFGVEVSI